MCHLNLEIRCTLKKKIPIFHFSEILSLAFQIQPKTDWFSRHLIDPAPLQKIKSADHLLKMNQVLCIKTPPTDRV